jgi:hypothetical protein
MIEWSNVGGHVTPAQAGVQGTCVRHWIPAFAGMTWLVLLFHWLFNHQ